MLGPFEHGEWVKPHQGKRSDIESATDFIKDLVASGANARTVRQKVVTEHTGVYTKFHGGLEKVIELLAPVPEDKEFIPRIWQGKIITELTAVPDDRTIMWVVDTIGNRGKSRLCKYLMCEMDAILLSGRVADMAYMYDGQRIAMFDVPRTEAENVTHLFSFAERLKNGMLNSTKYTSKLKHFNPPHVIFFANFCPESDVWSADRVKMFDLNCPNMHV